MVRSGQRELIEDPVRVAHGLDGGDIALAGAEGSLDEESRGRAGVGMIIDRLRRRRGRREARRTLCWFELAYQFTVRIKIRQDGDIPFALSENFQDIGSR